jgi:uncharacterized protein (TIGR02266 family)
MRDVAARFREYVRLDRRRRSGGLSVEELARWRLLKRALSTHFDPDARVQTVDRRDSIRVPTRLNVHFQTDGALASCLMTNISQHGVFVQTEQPLELKSRFELHIQVMSPPRTLVAPVEVVSVGMGPCFETDKQGMGLRFLSLDPETAKAIDELYERSVR